MNILDLLLSKVKKNKRNIHYIKKYYSFIERCKVKNLDYKGYKEDHHICPKSKSLFPEYSSFHRYPWNKIELTARQHGIAHWMLARAYEGEMWYAFQQILNCSTQNQKRHLFNSRVFAEARLKHSLLTSERFKGKVVVKDCLGNTFLVDKKNEDYVNGVLVPVNLGSKRSEETKVRISQSLTAEKHPNFGKKTDNAVKDKISKSLSGDKNPMYGKKGKDCPNFGKSRSEEHKRKISDSKKGKPRMQIKCPHCGKVGGEGVMKRWHFDNCKNLVNS